MNTQTAKAQENKEHFNKRVARARGDSWRMNISKMKMYHQANPTRLRQKRIQAGIMQRQMAKVAGLSLSTYGAIERSRRLVKRPIAQKIADELNTNLYSIFRKQQDSETKLIAIQ